MADPIAPLLSALAPEERPPDRLFVLKVERAMRERRRYRAIRAAIVRRLIGQALGVGALGASLMVFTRIPDVRAALSIAPAIAWPALASILLLWVVATRERGALR